MKSLYQIFIVLTVLVKIHFSYAGDASGETIPTCSEIIKKLFLAPRAQVEPIKLGRVPQVAADSLEHQAVIIEKGQFNQELWKETEKVVTFASKQMEKRRDWSSNFLKERLAISRKYMPNSQYIYTETTRTGVKEVSGSIGMTVSGYSKDSLKHELIPMEETHGWSLERPLDSKGQGKILEMRTYAIAPNVGSDPYGVLWSKTNQMIQDEFKNLPELRNQDVVFTYGDEKSIRMYRKMGFKLADPKVYPPVMHENTLWKVLVASPDSMLEAFLSKIDRPYVLKNLPYSIAVDTMDGRTWAASPTGIVMKGNKAIGFRTPHPVEVVPGVWAKTDSVIAYYTNAHLNYINDLANSVRTSQGLIAKPGSVVTFNRDGTVKSFYNSLYPLEIQSTTFNLPKSTLAKIINPHRIEMTGFKRGFLIDPKKLPGVRVADLSTVSWDSKERVITFLLAKRTRLSTKVYGRSLSTVQYHITPTGDYELLLVSDLAKKVKIGKTVFKRDQTFRGEIPKTIAE